MGVPIQWGRQFQRGEPESVGVWKSASNLVSRSQALDPGFAGGLRELSVPSHPGLIPVLKLRGPLLQAWPLPPPPVCWHALIPAGVGETRVILILVLCGTWEGIREKGNWGGWVCCRHRSWVELIWEGSQGEEATGLAGTDGGNQSSVAPRHWYLVTHSLLTHTHLWLCLAEPRGHDIALPGREGSSEGRPSREGTAAPQEAPAGLLWKTEVGRGLP